MSSSLRRDALLIDLRLSPLLCALIPDRLLQRQALVPLALRGGLGHWRCASRKDVSEHDPSKALDVIDLFRERNTRDELGLGGIPAA